MLTYDIVWSHESVGDYIASTQGYSLQTHVFCGAVRAASGNTNALPYMQYYIASKKKDCGFVQKSLYQIIMLKGGHCVGMNHTRYLPTNCHSTTSVEAI